MPITEEQKEELKKLAAEVELARKNYEYYHTKNKTDFYPESAILNIHDINPLLLEPKVVLDPVKAETEKQQRAKTIFGISAVLLELKKYILGFTKENLKNPGENLINIEIYPTLKQFATKEWTNSPETVEKFAKKMIEQVNNIVELRKNPDSKNPNAVLLPKVMREVLDAKVERAAKMKEEEEKKKEEEEQKKAEKAKEKKEEEDKKKTEEAKKKKEEEEKKKTEEAKKKKEEEEKKKEGKKEVELQAKEKEEVKGSDKRVRLKDEIGGELFEDEVAALKLKRKRLNSDHFSGLESRYEDFDEGPEEGPKEENRGKRQKTGSKWKFSVKRPSFKFPSIPSWKKEKKEQSTEIKDMITKAQGMINTNQQALNNLKNHPYFAVKKSHPERINTLWDKEFNKSLLEHKNIDFLLDNMKKNLEKRTELNPTSRKELKDHLQSIETLIEKSKEGSSKLLEAMNYILTASKEYVKLENDTAMGVKAISELWKKSTDESTREMADKLLLQLDDLTSNVESSIKALKPADFEHKQITKTQKNIDEKFELYYKTKNDDIIPRFNLLQERQKQENTKEWKALSEFFTRFDTQVSLLKNKAGRIDSKEELDDFATMCVNLSNTYNKNRFVESEGSSKETPLAHLRRNEFDIRGTKLNELKTILKELDQIWAPNKLPLPTHPVWETRVDYVDKRGKNLETIKAEVKAKVTEIGEIYQIFDPEIKPEKPKTEEEKKNEAEKKKETDILSLKSENSEPNPRVSEEFDEHKIRFLSIAFHNEKKEVTGVKVIKQELLADKSLYTTFDDKGWVNPKWQDISEWQRNEKASFGLGLKKVNVRLPDNRILAWADMVLDSQLKSDKALRLNGTNSKTNEQEITALMIMSEYRKRKDPNYKVNLINSTKPRVKIPPYTDAYTAEIDKRYEKINPERLKLYQTKTVSKKEDADYLQELRGEKKPESRVSPFVMRPKPVRPERESSLSSPPEFNPGTGTFAMPPSGTGNPLSDPWVDARAAKESELSSLKSNSLNSGALSSGSYPPASSESSSEKKPEVRPLYKKGESFNDFMNDQTPLSEGEGSFLKYLNDPLPSFAKKPETEGKGGEVKKEEKEKGESLDSKPSWLKP